MTNLGADYPLYNWQQNKGYPTVAHRKAILKLGLTPFHRKTFTVSDPQLHISF
jgi:ribonuclease HII